MTRRIQLQRGLDLPISGTPRQEVDDAPQVHRVALLGDDYVGLKPTMHVAEGDHVRQGDLLFTDKKLPDVRYTAPGCGKVLAIHRGAKRKFEAIVIELEGHEQLRFDAYPDHNLTQLEGRKVRENLIAAGLWPALRVRPYSLVADPTAVPHALFITAADTNPLAVDPGVVIARRTREFVAGVQALSTLTDGTTYLCRQPSVELPTEEIGCAEIVEFAGPHPAGLPGTHIHCLAPVSLQRAAWHINYQDVIAVGHLFLTGEFSCERVIALAGPAARAPRLLRTRLGADLSELTSGAYDDPEDLGVRVISGSVLSGRTSEPPHDFLGRYHLQVSLLHEGRQREFLGWAMPGSKKFSVTRAFSSAIRGGSTQRFALDTSQQGSLRAIVPIGVYEKVVPLDIVATPLLKALITGDTENAQMLGCLELDEEDLALCTFVCPGKHNYGPLLRQNLTQIQHDG